MILRPEMKSGVHFRGQSSPADPCRLTSPLLTQIGVQSSVWCVTSRQSVRSGGNKRDWNEIHIIQGLGTLYGCIIRLPGMSSTYCCWRDRVVFLLVSFLPSTDPLKRGQYLASGIRFEQSGYAQPCKPEYSGLQSIHSF